MYLALCGEVAGSNPVSFTMEISGLTLDANHFCWIFKSHPFALASVREKLAMRHQPAYYFMGLRQK